MKWKDKELKTTGDFMDHGIDKCDTPEEAHEFMKLYRAECPYAVVNIGYLSGYYSREKMKQIQEWFQVTHPIFGSGDITPEEAFRLGQMMGEAQKKRGDRR